eukprot:TRINITY_DN2617_c0_g1_i2.p1 TRINITY_DN2617_c0_g1~~TRINITY_DN2617_c0_g1_i2.p1  ORF type:complete len:239 (-),score=49.07 TRINITY_DN2617_c0_g1_i2:105-821(-)
MAKFNFESEVAALNSMPDNRNIVKYHNHYVTKTNFYIVMEYIETPSLPLSEYVNSVNDISAEDTQKIAHQLINGVSHMHDHGVAHRDIKPENVMINPETLDCKIIDFGFSCDCDQLNDTVVGSPLYMSPLILNNQPYIPKKADLWSVGVLIYELLYKKTPFEDSNTMEELVKNVNDTEMVELDEELNGKERLPLVLGVVVRNFLEKDPRNRIPASSIFGMISGMRNHGNLLHYSTLLS